MVQFRRDLDLTQEALGAERGRQLRPQHFHRHLAVVLQVLSEVGVRMSNRRIRLVIVTESYTGWWARRGKHLNLKELAVVRQGRGGS